MGFRELTMTDVREVLRRWQSGQSAREIARNGVADRKTAGRYIEAALGCGLSSDSELTDGVVAEVAQRVQARPLAVPSAPRKELELHRSRIEQWLGGDPPLRLVRVHELLARDGISIAYTTLRRFAHEKLGWRRRGRPRPSGHLGEGRGDERRDRAPPGREAHDDSRVTMLSTAGRSERCRSSGPTRSSPGASSSPASSPKARSGRAKFQCD